MDIAFADGAAMRVVQGREIRREKGAALIVVLGLVAVIAGWAATAAYEDMLSLRRVENSLASSKAELACLSALALMQQALKQDAKDNATDSLDDVWAIQAPPFPVDDGLVSGEVRDVNRFFNVNDLVDIKGKAVPAMVLFAKRLFRNRGVDESLVDALVDWQDSDSIPYGSGGAEDSSYLAKDYRVKNAPLDRWDELRMVQGFDVDVLKALKGVAIVWPVYAGRNLHVNVNTVEKNVWLSMFANMTDVDVDELLNNRPYKDTASFSTLVWAQGVEAQTMLPRLGVVSDGFMVRTHAIFGRADRREGYGLKRDGEMVSLLWRERQW